ncbi:MAG: DNA-binding domain-containing protein [Acidobacteriaceae bacterium]
MNLLELQRRMTEDVCRPLTPGYDMQQVDENGQLIEAGVASYIKPNARLTSFERLEIYNRQYWFRVIAAVSEDFPMLNAVLGQKRFDALILAYLMETPSRSWTLRDLSAKLPEFLDAHPEFAGKRNSLSVDVARLEWAYVSAFDGRQLPPLSATEVQAIGPNSRVSLQPHIQLLALRYPVDDLVLANHRSTPESDIVSSAASQRKRGARIKLPPMKRQQVFLAVHRFEDSVYYRRIERETFLLFSALGAGAGIAESIAEAFAKTRLAGEEQAILLRESFAHASELGWLCAPDNSAEHSEFKM